MPPSSETDDLAFAIGVSRVARVTRLDRTGVEVACAVRPGGHVLQVCNGKGETFEQARLGALLEAAELWAAEHVEPASLRWGSQAELERTGLQVWGADALGSAGALVACELWSKHLRIAWREATLLRTGRPVLVPAQALHCPPSGSGLLGPTVVAWTTNGSGAHTSWERALLHALLEAAERDQLARALPRGWTPTALSRRLLAPASLAQAPHTARLAQSLGEAGFAHFLYDLPPPPRESLGLPVAGCLLADRTLSAVPVAAGYACRLDPDSALLGALLEAAQSRLTDIHGARDDVAPADLAAMAELRAALSRVRPKRTMDAMPRGETRSADKALEHVVGALARRKLEAAVLDLAPPKLGVHVAKVVVPGFLVSEHL